MQSSPEFIQPFLFVAWSAEVLVNVLIESD